MEDISANKLQDKLKRYYERRAQFKSSAFRTRFFSIADHFVQLSLQSQSMSDEASARNISAGIPLPDLFEPGFGNTGNIQKVLITGPAGSGKSTLCSKIAYEWTRGLFSARFDYVFWIKLATLNDSEKKLSLTEWIAHECFGGSDDCTVDSRELSRLFNSEAARGRCLFLLDGFDEIRETFSQKIGWQKRLVEDLFSQFPHLVITSRDDEIHDGMISGIDRQIAIQGFSEDNIQRYLSILFKDNVEAKKSFLLFLSQRPVVSGLLKNPLNLFLLADLWQLKDNQRDLQFFKDNTTLVGLYEAFCMACLRARTEIDKTKSIRDLDEVYSKVLSVLGKAACKIRLGNSISGSVLIELCRESRINFNDLIKSGFLVTENIRDLTSSALYSFPHQTFHEFFAARNIAQRLVSDKSDDLKDVSDWIRAKKYNPNYVVVFSFISGLLSKAPDKDSWGIQAFYDALLTTRVDWVGLRHVVLMIHVLEHYDKDSFVTPKKRQKILEDILVWFEASIKNISSHQYFQQLIQRKLREAFSQCPQIANFCLKNLKEKWRKMDEETRKRVVYAYFVPLAHVLDDSNKLFFIDLLKAHKYESDFYAIVLPRVEWGSFKHFPAKDKDKLFEILQGLFRATNKDRTANKLLRICAVFALVEITLESEHELIKNIFSAFNKKNSSSAFLMAVSVAIGLLKNNFESELLSCVAAFIDNPDISSAKAVDDLKVLVYAVHKCEKVKVFYNLRPRLPEIHLESISVSKFQKKPEYSAGSTNLLTLVEEHGVAVVEEIAENKCQIILYSELLLDDVREKTRVEMLNFLTSLQDFLAPLGISSRGYEHFVALQKPRYAQSSKRSCGVDFFQGPAVQLMGLTPYLTVNHAKFSVAHTAEKAVGLPSEFLITRFDRRWRRCELLPVDADAMSFDIVEPQNILFMSERHAVQIELAHKNDPRRRVKELGEALRLVSANEELGVCRYLDLSGNKLDDTDLSVVCDSDIFKNLHCLILSNNTISYEGLSELLDMVGSLEVPLKYIMLRENYISLDVKCLALLDRVASKVGVVHLDLSLNYTSEESIEGSSQFELFDRRCDELQQASKKLWRFNFSTTFNEFESILNPGKKINKEDAVFALLESGLHWKLAVEYLNHLSQRILVLADLVVDESDKKICIRFFLTSPQMFHEGRYDIKNKGILKREVVLRKETGLFARIFSSQELQDFPKYKLGQARVDKVDCLGWLEHILGRFDIPVTTSRLKAVFSLASRKVSSSSRK